MGSFVSLQPSDHPRDLNIEEVSEIMNNGQWNFLLLNPKLPIEVVNHVKTFQPLGKNTNTSDKPWWILSKSGEFTVQTPWEKVRNRREKSWFLTKMWKKRFCRLKISSAYGGFGKKRFLLMIL